MSFHPSLAEVQKFARRNAGDFLEMDIRRYDEAGVEIVMPITDKCRQPMGLLHGGMSMVLAESAASLHACWGLDLTKQAPVGIEINGSHLRAARDGSIRAVARVIRRSRTLVVHEIEIFHVETGDLLCTSRVTNYIKTHAKS